jgi:hypothetical protein
MCMEKSMDHRLRKDGYKREPKSLYPQRFTLVKLGTSMPTAAPNLVTSVDISGV